MVAATATYEIAIADPSAGCSKMTHAGSTCGRCSGAHPILPSFCGVIAARDRYPVALARGALPQIGSSAELPCTLRRCACAIGRMYAIVLRRNSSAVKHHAIRRFALHGSACRPAQSGSERGLHVPSAAGCGCCRINRRTTPGRAAPRDCPSRLLRRAHHIRVRHINTIASLVVLCTSQPPRRA